MRFKQLSQKLVPVFLMAPLSLWLLLFAIIPISYGLWLSLHHAFIENLSELRWAGLTNYRLLFGDAKFLQSLQWSLLFAVISVAIEMTLGMGIAQLFNRRVPGKGLAITFLLLPMLVSAALMGTIFRLLLNEFVGPIAYLLQPISQGAALLGPEWANRTLILADVIACTPFVFINVYSALQSIPEEVLESASVEGANAWQRFSRISFPMILPIIGVTFLERLIAAFLIFDLVYTMTGGGPGTITQSVSIYIYRRAFGRSNFGMANAGSFTLAVMLLIPSLVLVKRLLRSLQ
ncbi:MAG: sugar ABC transporter permease [Anaerolineales bacterium]|nr:sugar ABC transporter permease [Anaerolineales bacterium]